MSKVKLHKIARTSGKVAPTAASRVGGEPIGMTRETWPRFEGEPMVHVVTLARDAIVPRLPERVAAVAVFVRSLGQNKAFSPRTKETAVVFLDAGALARGTTPAADVLGVPLEEDLAAACGVAVEEVWYDFDEVKESTQAESQMQQLDGRLLRDRTLHRGAAREQARQAAHGGNLRAAHVLVPARRGAGGTPGAVLPHRGAGPQKLNIGGGNLYVTADAECRSGAAWWQC